DLGSEIVSNWWERDFSWDGLAKIYTDARGKTESLQDYWKHVYGRMKLGEHYESKVASLDEFIKDWLQNEGKQWTPFHYPAVKQRPKKDEPAEHTKKNLYSGPGDVFGVGDLVPGILDLCRTGFLKYADFSGCLFDFDVSISDKSLRQLDK